MTTPAPPTCGAPCSPTTRPSWTAGSPSWPTTCVTTIRAPLPSAAPTRSALWPPEPNGWRVAAGTPSAPTGADPDPRAAAVVIHVVAEAATLDAAPDPHTSGERPSRPITPETTLAEALAPTPNPTSRPHPGRRPAHLFGGGTLPASHGGRADPRWGQGAAAAPSRRRTPRAGLSPLGRARALHPLPRYDLPVSRLRSPRRVRRHRPHHPLPARGPPTPRTSSACAENTICLKPSGPAWL